LWGVVLNSRDMITIALFGICVALNNGEIAAKIEILFSSSFSV
jgi:hypothetical protein